MVRTLSDKSRDIVGICETWMSGLTNPITAVIMAYGYKIHHDPRFDKRGGGTDLLYRSCYKLTMFKSSRLFSTFEYTAASIKTLTGTKVMFLVLYRPGSISSIFLVELDKLQSEIMNTCDCMVLQSDPSHTQ